MMIRADVKCYYCGHVSGQVEGDPAGSTSPWNYHARSGAIVSLQNPQHRRPRIRCGRCGGPVYIDEIESVRGLTPAARGALAALAS